MRALVDGDLLVYRCGFAAERAEYRVVYRDREYDEEMAVWCENAKGAQAVAAKLEEDGYKPEIEQRRNVEPVENALHNVKSMIETAMEALAVSPDEVEIHLSGPGNYRDQVATIKPYKGNRDESHKPTHGDAIKQYMEKNWVTVWSEDEEADDTLGYTHYALWQEDPFSSVLVTADKDLNMIPGLHYNFLKEEQFYVDEDEANAFFWTQMLTGDSTDNIVGCPGIGPKRAAAALEGCRTPREMYDVVHALYVQHYGPQANEVLTEMGQLLWIRRQPEELWTPQSHVLQCSPSSS